MPSRAFVFDQPNRFVALAIGAPGNRAFFLQAGQGRAVVTLGLEKIQVAALAERIDELLDAVAVPPTDRGRGGDVFLSEAVEPMIELFRVGTMVLGWDAEGGAVVIEARSAAEIEADEADERAGDPEADQEAEAGDVLRVRLTPAQAQQFSRAATAVVVAGRPACPFCGEPLDPSGHFCPRTIGQLN